MILCDAGPLIALVDRNDAHHKNCVAALASVTAASLTTTWPCFTEAMHLLYRAGGIAAQNELWGFVADGLVEFHLPTPEEWRRMHALMNDYADMPLDLADASLITAAEVTGCAELFSIDARLRAIKLADSTGFSVTP